MQLLRAFTCVAALCVVFGRSEDEEACVSAGSCKGNLAAKKGSAMLQTRGSLIANAGASACWLGPAKNLYYKYCNKKCNENGLGYSCSGYRCGKCKTEEPKPVEPEEPLVTAKPGWILADAGSNCMRACTSKGLVCKNKDLLAHIPDVDSKKDIAKIAESVGVECESYTKMYGTNSAIPMVNYNLDGAKCSYSDPVRDLTNIDCTKLPKAPTKTGIFKHRLCYCSEKATTETEPEPPKPDEVSPQCYPDCSNTASTAEEQCMLPECDGCPICDELGAIGTEEADGDGDEEETATATATVAEGEAETPAPTPEPLSCENLCEPHTKDWQIKCGWVKCGGCDTCKTTKPCWSFCATKPYSWDAKCEWSNCVGCSDCD